MAIIYKTFRILRTVFCAVFTCFLLAIQPVEAADELFTVEGVQVDVTAASALAARDQAFDKAQVDAFTILAGRMLSESELEHFKAPDAATVSPMVADYEVTAEKLSSVRYIGTYTFSFRASAVERYLNVQGASYTNVVSAPLVILPFYQTGGRTFLWSPYNVWMRAWNRANSQTLVPVIVPIGDLEDVSDIGDDDVFSYSPAKLVSLLKRYDAGDAVIAVAVPNGSLGKAVETDPANGAVTISLYRTDRGQPEHVREIVVESQSGDTLGKLLDRAVAEVQTALKQNWKEKTVVQNTPMQPAPESSKNAIVARVKIASLEEWSRTQQALGRVNAVTGTQLKSLSPKEALVELSFRGDENMLRAALAQAGMDLGFPKYAGPSSADDNRLVYDLNLGGRPVQQQQPQPQPLQPSGYQSPRMQTPQYQQPLPREQIQSHTPPGGYPLPPRNNITDPGYSGRF